MSKNDVFLFIKRTKQNMSVQDLVGPKDSRAWPLLKMISTIFSLSFSQTPDYFEYRNMLKQVLQSMNERSNNQFDWNKEWYNSKSKQILSSDLVNGKAGSKKDSSADRN